jgi:hypothetical protein
MREENKMKQTKNPKQSTLEELRKLAKILHENRYDDPHNFKSNTEYYVHTALEEEIKLSSNTIRASVIHIENELAELRSIDYEKTSLNTYIKEVKASLSIDRIIIELTDGSKKTFIEEVSVLPIPVQSGSLFNGSIITRGKHIGCNVKSKSSILGSFGDYKAYRKWLITLSSPGITGKLNGPTVTDDTIKLRNLIAILDNYLKTTSDTL